MSDTGTKQKQSLTIRRTVHAQRERVFEAWTQAAELKKWWRASAEHATPIAEVDARPGGRYRLAMKAPGADMHVVGGEFREVTPPSRLVFTWKWEGHMFDMDENTVTVEFHARGQEGQDTEIVLTHEFFPSEEIRDKHDHGWNAVLEQFAAHVSS